MQKKNFYNDRYQNFTMSENEKFLQQCLQRMFPLLSLKVGARLSVL